MNGKIAKIGLVSVLILISISVASAATITVNDDGGADYTKIQDAVNNASVGDFIEVWNGTYNENVDVNKRLTIYSRDRASVTIVEAADSGDHVFEVTADYVNISEFTVKGANGSAWSSGIYLSSVDHCNISGNSVSNNDKGICLWYSTNNIITNNNAWTNAQGIYPCYSSCNTIINNNVSNNAWGMYLHQSNNNRIENNIASNNHYGYGISLAFSSNNQVLNNIANGNQDSGIKLRERGTINNIVANNIVDSNRCGIDLFSADNNKLINNTVSNNSKSIFLWGSSETNEITNNTLLNNGYGIYLGYPSNSQDSSNNMIYLNNFINNGHNAYSYASTNIWNSTSRITYTYNGSQYTNYLGNYWDDYDGTDEGKDGIGDASYSIDSDKDDYPLMGTWVDHTIIDTTPPTITFVPPTPANNSEVNVDYVFVNVTLNENGNTALLNWNGTNETMLGSNMNFYLNKTGLSNGIYTYRVNANDTSDNLNVSDARVVTVNVPASITDIESSSETGVRKDRFNAEESVFASGSNYAINKDYNISIVADQTWTDGMDIPDRAAGTANKVFTDSSGDIAYSDLEGAGTPPALIWSAAVDDGTYDIVIDVNENGKYDAGIDVLDDKDVGDAGFVVVTSPVEVPAITPLSFLLSLLSLLGLGAVAMREM